MNLIIVQSCSMHQSVFHHRPQHRMKCIREVGFIGDDLRNAWLLFFDVSRSPSMVHSHTHTHRHIYIIINISICKYTYIYTYVHTLYLYINVHYMFTHVECSMFFPLASPRPRLERHTTPPPRQQRLQPPPPSPIASAWGFRGLLGYKYVVYR